MIAASSTATTASLKARGIQPVYDPESVRVTPEQREAMEARGKLVRVTREMEVAKPRAEARERDIAAWLALAASMDDGRPTATKIIRRFAKATGYSVVDLKGASRNRKLVLVRMAAMYWIRRRLGLSLPQIGRRFGNRDHTTVLNAIRVYPARRARSDVKLREVP